MSNLVAISSIDDDQETLPVIGLRRRAGDKWSQKCTVVQVGLSSAKCYKYELTRMNTVTFFQKYPSGA